MPRRRRDGRDHVLRYESPEQYRARFGREPEPFETPPQPQPTAVAVMAEYGCWLWGRSAERLGSIDPDELGVSAQLVERLDAWNEEWEDRAATDRDFSGAAYRSWAQLGWRLAGHLQRELPDVRVSYRHHPDGERPVDGYDGGRR